MTNRKYSVIVFDLGNVLIPFNYDTALEKLDKIDKGMGNRFWSFYQDNYQIHRGFERGDIPEEEFIKAMLTILDNKVDEKTFCEYYSGVFTENKDVSALLPELKKKYMLVLLSNTNSIHREYGWKDYSFLKYFDKLILSHEVNSLKPEEKIYRSVENFTHKPSAEHIFIDDVEEYVLAAKKCGWDGVQFKNYTQLVGDLKGRGII
ncbi:MAG: HAD-IA family hydrolase [Ignavibacteriaceae bacterium]